MSIFQKRIEWDKHCFVYCGPEHCNCGASAAPSERAEHEKEMQEQACRKMGTTHRSCDGQATVTSPHEAVAHMLRLAGVQSSPDELEAATAIYARLSDNASIDDFLRACRNADADVGIPPEKLRPIIKALEKTASQEERSRSPVVPGGQDVYGDGTGLPQIHPDPQINKELLILALCARLDAVRQALTKTVQMNVVTPAAIAMKAVLIQALQDTHPGSLAAARTVGGRAKEAEGLTQER